MAISLYELSQRISSSMPLGTIVPYYGTDEPSGWKICDGRSCAGSELAKKLGISNVPDLRGRFIRMIGGNAAGMAVAQDMMIQKHTHSYQACSGDGSGVGWGGCARPTFQTGATGGVETRPINMAFNYIIRIGANVILYYVSNIIYKAIAIGKSLLSRVKEEVRRTMAISLKNHEDRITELEKPLNITKIFQLDFNSPHDTASLKWSDYNKYDFLLFFTDGSRDASNRVGSGCYRDFRFIPTRIFSEFINGFCFMPGFTFNGSSDDSSSLGVLGYECFECSVDFNADITVRRLIGSLGVYTDNRVVIYGLKQYYCFSNNILLYRLTQILFDSSLLGLFSQKGGARTI